MNYYKQTHKYYCGIDLHTKTMYVCIINAIGETLLHIGRTACFMLKNNCAFDLKLFLPSTTSIT